MLKPEQAAARLAEWQLPREQNRIAESIRRLPTRLSDLAAWAYRCPKVDPNNLDGGWEEAGRRGQEATVELDSLSVSERAQIFAVISPNLAPAMERAWQLLKTTPYQTGYLRKAFRTPRHPESLAKTLYRWMLRLAQALHAYPAELLSPTWLATWAPYLDESYTTFGSEIGALLAPALIQSDGEAIDVFEILRQSLNGQHDIGAPGRHIYSAFLLSDRPEAWELIEKTLLAAQRQEGLRQAILEAIDLTHPQAFRRMLRLVLEHDLYRFSSVVRAVDVWFGLRWSATSGGTIRKMLEQVVRFLDDHAARAKALKGKDAEAAFLALWCVATEDAFASVPFAEKMLRSKSVELRYVAARHLANLDLKAAWMVLVPALDDDDLRVALLALPWGQYSSTWPDAPQAIADERFERLVRLVDRLPATPQKFKPLVWPWTEFTVKQQQVASWLLPALGDRPATRLIPHLSKLDPRSRATAIENIVAAKPWDETTRKAIVELAGDASGGVRHIALKALENESLGEDNIERLESYFTRKSGDLRSGVLAILLKQDDAAALASSKRLLDSKDANQRLAGLELLRHLAAGNRAPAECRHVAASYESRRKKLSKDERAHLDEIHVEKASVPTLHDALGFMNPAERSPVVAPRNLNVPFITPAAIACLTFLDELIHKHRETLIRIDTYSGVQEQLLGNVQWGFPHPDFDKPRDGQGQKLPLIDVWRTWYAERASTLRDVDGLELVRALIWSEHCVPWLADEWRKWANRSPQHETFVNIVSGGQDPTELQYPHTVARILEWLLFLNPCDARDYLLDAVETSYSLVPTDDMSRLGEPLKQSSQRHHYWVQSSDENDWRSAKAFTIWSDSLSRTSVVTGLDLTAEQQVRLWRLMHWRGEPFPGARRQRPNSDLLCAAYDQQAANLADIADHVLGPRGMAEYGSEPFDFLRDISARKLDKKLEAWLARHPQVKDLTQRAIERVVNLELGRGDAPTAATNPALSLSSLTGVETLRRVLHALGKSFFKVVPYWASASNADRRESLTHLAKISYPNDDETPTDFVAVMRAAVEEGQFPEERLLQLVFLAPQWLKCVEAYFGWEQMSEGVYWFLAHMRYIGGLGEAAAEATGRQHVDDGEPGEDVAGRDEADSGDSRATTTQRTLSAWERLILERTPLTAAERDEGAIDMPWFRRTYAVLGDKRWQRLAAAARFAANASQANRAKFLADVLLNRISRKTLVDGINKRQLKDHVRLLGLLPLAKGTKREGDLLEHCRILREYRRYANQLSGLTKPSALRAWEIGMRNLAQTAGYPDPLRLEWAVGADAVKDLAGGPVVVQKDGVVVHLSLDELSKPVVTVRKGDKELKSIPPAIKKDKKVAELTARVTDLKRQASGIRQSLEAAMCRGDGFTGAELREWCGHALLAPLLSRLIVIGEGVLGYPDKQGKALRDHRGKLEPVKPGERLRLAHPNDLLATQAWHEWQHECFAAERIQPFKQVFRELYVVTKQESKDGAISHRYDGQQVQPTQAIALFGQRGWNTQDGVLKVFHDLELTAGVFFNSGIGTPAEVEGATISGVSFTKRDQWKPIPLAEVPPRVFSEVMRDLDLVVSMAHAGGVDPEASASTVEMRENLLRETCALLSLSNVRFKANHAIIDGELANYSVHLGSGSVHTLPGGALCIVPVHAQHRGRLFLPFADDDPRTAEVISKVLLLARDLEIQDPIILEQIRR